MPSTDTDNTATKEWGIDDDLNAVVEKLQPGDEVVVDDRERALTVFDKTDAVMGSDAHPTHIALLEGRGGRVYRLRGPYRVDDDYSTPPSLELRQEGNWKTKSSAITKLAVENWTERIRAEMSAAEFIKPTVETQPTLGTPTGSPVVEFDESPPAERTVGECPKCESPVVEQDERAVCTGCPSWCWLTQWEAHEDAC